MNWEILKYILYTYIHRQEWIYTTPCRCKKCHVIYLSQMKALLTKVGVQTLLLFGLCKCSWGLLHGHNSQLLMQWCIASSVTYNNKFISYVHRSEVELRCAAQVIHFPLTNSCREHVLLMENARNARDHKKTYSSPLQASASFTPIRISHVPKASGSGGVSPPQWEGTAKLRDQRPGRVVLWQMRKLIGAVTLTFIWLLRHLTACLIGDSCHVSSVGPSFPILYSSIQHWQFPGLLPLHSSLFAYIPLFVTWETRLYVPRASTFPSPASSELQMPESPQMPNRHLRLSMALPELLSLQPSLFQWLESPPSCHSSQQSWSHLESSLSPHALIWSPGKSKKKKSRTLPLLTTLTDHPLCMSPGTCHLDHLDSLLTGLLASPLPPTV